MFSPRYNEFCNEDYKEECEFLELRSVDGTSDKYFRVCGFDETCNQKVYGKPQFQKTRRTTV